MSPDLFETEADALADSSLRELGADPYDLPNEYDTLCEYAGCYPWLGEMIHQHPHDEALPGFLNGDEFDLYTC